jgi:hypothetical protein
MEKAMVEGGFFSFIFFSIFCVVLLVEFVRIDN